MISRINDSRIGIRNEQGRITQFPSRYANGGYLNSRNNPAPTTVYFGPGNRFFYALPIGVARLHQSTRRELESIVADNMSEEDAQNMLANMQSIQTEKIAIQSKQLDGDQEGAAPKQFAFSIRAPKQSAESFEDGKVVVKDEVAEQPKSETDQSDQESAKNDVGETPSTNLLPEGFFEGILPVMEEE